MKKKCLSILGAGLLTIGTSGMADGEDLWPLNVSNTWTYNITLGSRSGEKTITVVGEVMIFDVNVT